MKKLPTLHILNGDASLPAFSQATIPGQVLVWREILSEGPVLYTLPEHEFWKKRQGFITSVYGEKATEFKHKVLDEVQKLEGLGAFFEVVLWFDADLMCQVNLLYLLQCLQHRKQGMVSVCTPPPGQQIAHLGPDALQQLHEQRLQVSREQLQQARELWELYASPHPLKLQLFLQQMPMPVPYMEEALKLHLLRFPNCTDGLSQPERALLQYIQDGATTMEEVMRLFWQQDPGYGFGDAQLRQLLFRLQPDLVQAKEPLTLSFFGDRVLEQYASFTPKAHWLGGVEINGHCPYCFDSDKSILRKTS